MNNAVNTLKSLLPLGKFFDHLSLIIDNFERWRDSADDKIFLTGLLTALKTLESRFQEEQSLSPETENKIESEAVPLIQKAVDLMADSPVDGDKVMETLNKLYKVLADAFKS